MGSVHPTGNAADDRLQALFQDFSPLPSTSYAYDGNGNLTGVTRADGTSQALTWDFEDRLLSVTDSKTLLQAAYAYDALGERVAKRVGYGSGPAVTTDYLVDPLTAFAQVVEERQNGTIAARYDYGAGGSAVRSARYAAGLFTGGGSGSLGGGVFYNTGDGLDSTATVTDASGQAVAGGAFRYDGFGNLLGGDGGLQPSLYNGQQYDAETGLYYLRARYYSPELGRFVSADPMHADGNDYAYAGNDPINMVDPSGHESLVGQLVTVAIQTFLSSYDIKAAMGLLGGAAYAYGDAYLSGKSQAGIDADVRTGALTGTAFGLASSIPGLHFLLAAYGTYQAAHGTAEALGTGNYRLAAYRGFFTVLGAAELAHMTVGAVHQGFNIARGAAEIDALSLPDPEAVFGGGGGNYDLILGLYEDPRYPPGSPEAIEFAPADILLEKLGLDNGKLLTDLDLPDFDRPSWQGAIDRADSLHFGFDQIDISDTRWVNDKGFTVNEWNYILSKPELCSKTTIYNAPSGLSVPLSMKKSP